MLKPLRLSSEAPRLPAHRQALMEPGEAAAVERLFGVLASATRLRLLHAVVREGDPCMSDLATAVGMKPQAVSNQLRKLQDMGILGVQRHGNHRHYRLEHPMVKALLVHALELAKQLR